MHLCGAGAGALYAKRGFRLLPGRATGCLWPTVWVPDEARKLPLASKLAFPTAAFSDTGNHGCRPRAEIRQPDLASPKPPLSTRRKAKVLGTLSKLKEISRRPLPYHTYYFNDSPLCQCAKINLSITTNFGKSNYCKYVWITWTRPIHASTVVRLTGLQLGRYRLDVFLEPALEFEALQSGLSRTSDLRRPVAVWPAPGSPRLPPTTAIPASSMRWPPLCRKRRRLREEHRVWCLSASNGIARHCNRQAGRI